MKVYVAGPMTWHPQFNFPAFDAMKARLVNLGYDVVSPAELDSPEDRARAMASPDGHPIHYDSGMTHGDFLARDVKIIADGGIEGIVVLPGWETSKGARWETYCGHLNLLPVYRLVAGSLMTIGIEELATAWTGIEMGVKVRDGR